MRTIPLIGGVLAIIAGAGMLSAHNTAGAIAFFTIGGVLAVLGLIMPNKDAKKVKA